MTQNDAATLSVGTGKFYTGAVGAVAPTTFSGLLTPSSTTWTDIGHTSIEDIIAFSSEGGEATSLGTLQAPQLRTKYSPRTEAFTINVQQWDDPSLKLYYGANFTAISTGAIFSGVPAAPVVTTKAFLGVFQDGNTVFGIYAPKAELFRADDVDFSDTESLTSLPLQIKPLIYQTNTWAFAVTPLGVVGP